MRRLFATVCLLPAFILGACAEDERSAFDPNADTTPPELIEFEIVQEGQKVYVLWSANEPARLVVEYRPTGSTGFRHAYSGDKEWAEAGIVPMITVFSDNDYEILGIRVTDRAGNTTTVDPPEGFETLATDAIAREDIFIFVMIDVGWGDALFMQAPDGTTCLIDAGHPFDGPRVEAFLRAYFIDDDSLDFASLSHVHSDHIGGFYGDSYSSYGGLLASFAVGTFLDILDKTPGTVNGPYRDLEDALASMGSGLGRRVRLAPGASSATNDALQWGAGVKVDLLAAGQKDFLLPDYILQEETGSVQNNDSMVYRVQYGDFVMILMGDGEFATEQYLQNRWPLEFLEADVLKLGHHGSNDSNSERFIDVVDPRIALITNAVSENPGVMHPYVLNRLRTRGIDYFASDRAIPNLDRAERGIRGDIIIETDGHDYTVTAINLLYE